MKIHFTDIRTFKECRRKFRFAVVDRLEKINLADYYGIGKYGHQLLASHYSGVPNTEIQINDEDREFCESLYKLYLEEYSQKDKQWKVEQVETPIEVNVNGVDITFTMDLLVTYQGRKYIVDHKFLQRTPNGAVLDLDEQLKGYIFLAKKAGIDAYGAIYNVIVKKTFKKPSPLKTGKLSTAQTTLDSTTYNLYLEAIVENGLNPKAYEAELDALKQRGTGIFTRFPAVIKSELELSRYALELDSVLFDMEECHKYSYNDYMYYPSPSYMCASCQFFDLCKMKNSASEKDYEMYKKQDYRIKEEDER